MIQTILNFSSNLNLSSYTFKEVYMIVERLAFVGLCSVNPLIAYMLLSYLTYSKSMYAKHINPQKLQQISQALHINRALPMLSKYSNIYSLKK